MSITAWAPLRMGSRSAPIARGHPSLGEGILDVVFLRSFEQMIIVDARPDVAFVKPTWQRVSTVLQEEREAVGLDMFATSGFE